MQYPSIALIGLPGSGKSRLKSAFLQSLSSGEGAVAGQADHTELYEISDLTELNEMGQTLGCVLCVIDVRSRLQSGCDDWLEAQLQKLLGVSQGVVFNFLEASSLDDQAWWGRWIKSNAPDLPILRVLNGVIPANWADFDCAKQAGGQALALDEEVVKLQTFEFQVGRICLDHLLLGLDSSKQNLAMKIVRVTGVVETLEYQNLVEIQGSALRWDMFAAEANAQVGVIKIQGYELDRAWLQELVKASLV